MKRLFFALWPDETERQVCAELTKAVSSPAEKPVRPENLHMTLVFLGGIDAETEAAITLAASAIPPPKVTITFDQLNFWRKPRILCLSGHSDDTDLCVLVDKLNEISQTFNIPVDERLFTPHITLVRKAKALRTVNFQPIIWQANTFCLVESRSVPDGVEYRVIREWGNNTNSD